MQKIIIALLLLAALLVVGGYGYWKNSQPIPMDYLVASGGVPELLSKIIKYYEIDKENGLDINFISANPGDIERREFSGEVEGVLVMSPFTAVKSTIDGRPMKILFPVTNMTYYMAVRANSPVKSLEDLVGKKVAMLSKATVTYNSVAMILKSAGIDPDKDLLTTYATIPEMIELLKNGQVEAATVNYPGAANLFASGQFRSIATLEDIWENNENGVPHPFVVNAAFEDWYAKQSNKKIAERFAATFFEVIARARQNQNLLTEESNPLVKEYLEQNKLTSEPAKKLVRENVLTFLPSGWTKKESDSILYVLKAAQVAGYLPRTINVEETVAPAPNQE